VIKVPFDPEELEGEEAVFWETWSKRAETATSAVIEEYSKEREVAWTRARQKVWQDLRNWLRDRHFKGKCAYCESDLRRRETDAEHFRPKGAVDKPRTEGAAESSEVTQLAGGIGPHPGYFWLAFHWKNILPTCSMCNRGHKGNQFPAKNYKVFVELKPEEKLKDPEEAHNIPGHPGRYLLSPDDLDVREERLVLNPMFDEPAEHLRFSPWGGKIRARKGSEIGKATIDAFGLGTNDLDTLRHKAQNAAKRRFRIYESEAEEEVDTEEEVSRLAWERIQRVLEDAKRTDYRAACHDALVQKFGAPPE
jgi:hypothetical protein